jgi:head-tail adaptor
MRLGDLRDNLIFQAPSGSPVTWTTIFTAKGQKRDLSGVEKIAALQAGGIITGSIWIQWRPVNIKTTWRILREGRYLNIVSVLDMKLPEGRYWKIQIKEVA